jgi:peptidyl-prolyl cis-trans isomerase SurA
MIKYLKISLITFFLMFSYGLTIENKIILKIDNEIITTIDVYQEITSLKFFNKNLNQLRDEEIYQIAVQSILKNKIKEYEISKNFNVLEFQNENYLNQKIEETYRNLGFQNLKDFKDQMLNNEISFEKFKQKIITDIVWNQIIYLKYSDKLVVDKKKLKEQIKNKSKTLNSINLREIIFEVNEVKDIEIKYDLIKKDIMELGFENAAIKHSISNTSARGGNLGWIEENIISDELANELNKIPLKSFTNPIRISSGFLILQKFDEKKIQKEFNADKELEKLINREKNQQLNNFSNLYYNKVKKNIKINAP